MTVAAVAAACCNGRAQRVESNEAASTTLEAAQRRSVLRRPTAPPRRSRGRATMHALRRGCEPAPDGAPCPSSQAQARRVAHIGPSSCASEGRGSVRMPMMMIAGMKPQWNSVCAPPRQRRPLLRESGARVGALRRVLRAAARRKSTRLGFLQEHGGVALHRILDVLPEAHRGPRDNATGGARTLDRQGRMPASSKLARSSRVVCTAGRMA